MFEVNGNNEYAKSYEKSPGFSVILTFPAFPITKSTFPVPVFLNLCKTDSATRVVANEPSLLCSLGTLLSEPPGISSVILPILRFPSSVFSFWYLSRSFDKAGSFFMATIFLLFFIEFRILLFSFSSS